MKNKEVYLGVFIYTFILLFGVSNDSFLYDIYDRVDSACFYMCGKAWVNGLTPYVDFADSKGPVLWLIYGLGYLLSPYNYIGVFGISVLSYFFVFYYCFRICNLYLDSRYSFIAMALMGAAFFNPFFYTETRAEDFCNPLNVMSLFYLIIYLRGENKVIRKISFIFGLAFATSFLMKFTIAAMSGIFFLIVFCDLLIKRDFSNLRKSICYYIITISSVIFPFIVYFAYKGCLIEFVQEYFLNTFLTVESSTALGNPLKSYIYEWLWTFRLRTERFGMERLFYVCYFILSFWFSWKDRKRTGLIPTLIFFWFLAISIYHSKWNYYLCSCSFLAIFGVIVLISSFSLHVKKIPKVCVFFTMSLITCATIFWNYCERKDHFFLNGDRRNDFYSCEFVMSQIENPTIVYLGLDIGFGTTCNSLPGGKYWITQHGMTPKMLQEQLDDIKKLKPDFVSLWKLDHLEYLKSLGYVCYGQFNLLNERVYYLLGKPGLNPAKKELGISDIDILLKRRLNL